MNRDVILADMAIAVMGASSVIFGMGGEGMIHKITTLLGGVCLGYVITTYLNVEEL